MEGGRETTRSVAEIMKQRPIKVIKFGLITRVKEKKERERDTEIEREIQKLIKIFYHYIM